MSSFRKCALILICLFLLSTGTCNGEVTVVTLTNECSYKVWAAVSSVTVGLGLEPGQTGGVAVPAGWSGTVWARTLCSESDGGKLFCLTGDGGGAVSQVELDLGVPGGMDRYGFRLVNGFNLPLSVQPLDPTCKPTGCVTNLNEACPQQLRVTVTEGGAVVACLTQPSLFSSHFFKSHCPLQNAYFTCASTHYTIFFCPNTTWFQGNDDNGNEVHFFASFLVKVIAGVLLSLIPAASFYIFTAIRSRGRDAAVPSPAAIQFQISNTIP